jgi:hypothetical protein
MSFDERVKKAADLVVENDKQLVTVAAGILTFTVTFYEKLKGGDIGWAPWLLVVAWVAYLFSIWNGFRTLDGLTAKLGNLGTTFTVFDDSITRPASLQRRFFLVGTVLVVLFGAIVVAKRG